MSRRVIAGAAAGLVMALASLPVAARADVTVIGGGFAEDCSKSAKAVAVNLPPLAEAIHLCTLALDTEVLDAHDTASTYVNRGVLYMTLPRYDLAVRDFDAALAIEPQLGEAYVNRGAVLIAQGRNAPGIADIDRGLALHPSQAEKAYFNRALAEENLNDLKAAYDDYRRALELKPDWDLPKAELARFTVTRK